MMELILIILVSYGISNIVVFGAIFEKLRDYAMAFSPNFWGKLLTCMMCTPFWVGFFLSLGSYLSGYTQFSPFYGNGLENIYLSLLSVLIPFSLERLCYQYINGIKSNHIQPNRL